MNLDCRLMLGRSGGTQPRLLRRRCSDSWTPASAARSKDTTLTVEDEAQPGDYHQTNIERIARSGGGDLYFDEFAKVYRVTAFYHVKVNL